MEVSIPMNTEPTIRVTRVENAPALKMLWSCNIHPPDVGPAFQDINYRLNEASKPLFVMVDIGCNPNFPIFETVIHAATGPFRNPKLREWLIIGENVGAKRIENLLTRMTGSSNVRWFDDEAEAMAYIRAQTLIELAM